MRLIIRNSAIVVKGYIWGSSERLQNQFKLFDMVTHTNYYVGLYYDEDNKTLYLPRGIDIWFVEKCIGVKREIDFDYDEYEQINPKIGITKAPRDDIQKQALRFLIGEGEECETNKYESQLSCNLNTGKGKTYVSIATLSFLRVRSIIITYSNNWLTQWKQSMLDYTTAKNDDIYKISGADSIDMLLSGKSIHTNHSLYLITHSTLQSYASTYGWDKITELFKILKIGFKFYDEAHLNFKNMYMIDFFTNTFRTYYITATPARSSDEENKIFQYYIKNIPSIELFDEEEDPHTSYISLMYNSMPTPQNVSHMRNAYGLDINKYTSYIVSNENFRHMLNIVIQMVCKLIIPDENYKAMLFIHTNEALLELKDYISKLYPELAKHIGVFTSIAENKESEKNKKIILTTIKSAGAAVDIKGLKVVVILADPFRSSVNARQILGRTRDKDTYLLELIDLGFFQIKKWYYSKLPTYQKYAIDTKEVLLRHIELLEKSDSIIESREWRNKSCGIMKFKTMPSVVFNTDNNKKQSVKFHSYMLKEKDDNYK